MTKFKNLKIQTQLVIGFMLILFMVVFLAGVAYVQTATIQKQAELMYKHPLQVRTALGRLQNDVTELRLGLRQIMLVAEESQRALILNNMLLTEADVTKQFQVLQQLYLGPVQDIAEAEQNYLIWSAMHSKNTERVQANQNGLVVESLKVNGEEGLLRDRLIQSLGKIDDFAAKKSESLYNASVEMKSNFNQKLLFFSLAILVLTLIILYTLIGNIRKPLKELIATSNALHLGNWDARNVYDLSNEFGELAVSFNILAESVQNNRELSHKTSELSRVMLSEDHSQRFFQVTLHTLAEHTGSQVASIFLLSKDQKTYEHFESIGLTEAGMRSFRADHYEGEFGAAIFSKKMQRITNIDAKSAFVFSVVSGDVLPNEIITIPILSGNTVFAIISLASIKAYSTQSIELINQIISTMSARIDGVLAYRKLKVLAEQLEEQNVELDSQKNELFKQTEVLIQQNHELDLQKKQLNESSQLKTNFLSNMSHELRTPLNSVIALSGVLGRRLVGMIPDEEYRYLDIIERNGKNLLNLINDILDISRIESGKEEFDITEFNMNALLVEVMSLIEHQALNKDVKLNFVASGSDAHLKSDVDKCKHILQNLIANAIKFTDNGSVDIQVDALVDQIDIRITDTGIGIADDQIEGIFDEFRQADGSTSRKYGGTGLGLAIAQKYANLLGGKIVVKSILGEGSEFVVTLPRLVSVPESKPTDRVDRTEKTKSRSVQVPHSVTKQSNTIKTLLLVEDSEPAIIQMKDLLEGRGYEVLISRSALEALKLFEHIIPDAMIIDLMMPDIDGFELLQTIRDAEITAHIPVLVLTAKYISKEELKILKRNNIHQLIQKGAVNRQQLLDEVSTMLYPELKQVNKPPRSVQKITRKPVVLIVEDNPDNMITVKAVLEDQYVILEAVEGDSAIHMAQEHIPDLILMDIALPGKSGIEVFQVIREQAALKHIPIIALTASAMTHDRETILSYGFDAFIAKPIIAKELNAKMREVLYGN